MKRLTNTELSSAKEIKIDHFPAVHEIKNKILDNYFLSTNELLKISKENKTDKRLNDSKTNVIEILLIKQEKILLRSENLLKTIRRHC